MSWLNQKIKLKLEDYPTKWVLTQDCGIKGAKQFARFETYNKMINYLNNNKNKALYEVIQTVSVPCFMYFDIDLPDTENRTDYIVNIFKNILAEFLANKYHIIIELHEGENCEIAIASTDKKCSIHFIGKIVLPNISTHKLFTVEFIDYIIQCNTLESKELLFINNKQEVQCAIDTSVYSNFRSYRCLTMEKEGKHNFLRAYGDSSKEIADHMVCSKRTLS